MKVRFISLASGSSGNCYYIGTEKYGILIDAGIAVRTIKKGLKEAGINMEMIRAVFVTHDHADHIKAVGGLGEKLNIPIYTTARIHEGINKSYCMTEKLHSSVRYLEKQQPMQLEDFRIESFEVPHDGTDNVLKKHQFNPSCYTSSVIIIRLGLSSFTMFTMRAIVSGLSV